MQSCLHPPQITRTLEQPEVEIQPTTVQFISSTRYHFPHTATQTQFFHPDQCTALLPQALLTKGNSSQDMRSFLLWSHQLRFPAHLQSVWWASPSRTAEVLRQEAGTVLHCCSNSSSRYRPPHCSPLLPPFNLFSLLTVLLLFKTGLANTQEMTVCGFRVGNNSGFMVCRQVQSRSNNFSSLGMPGQ